MMKGERGEGSGPSIRRALVEDIGIDVKPRGDWG